MSGKSLTEPFSAHCSPLTASPVGVFGGTFDPIHFGHLRLAEDMADALGLGCVRFIPAGQPPHRDAPRTAAYHRLEMVRRAIAGNPRFEADAREIECPAPSYTVDTLTGLRTELGRERPLWLLLGADAFLGLPGWHEWKQLFGLANIAVAARPGSATQGADAIPAALQNEVLPRQVADAAAAGAAGAILLRQTPPLDISATAIRNTLARGGSARYWLPDAVLDYIHEQKLYT